MTRETPGQTPDAAPRRAIHALILCDIDGCLNAGKGVPLDLATLAVVADRVAGLRLQGIGVTLCSGRPQPYVEAVAQMLGIGLPYVCENGALLHDPVTDRATLLAAPKDLAPLLALRARLQAQPEACHGLSIEPGKEASLSLSGPALGAMTPAERTKVIAALRGLAQDARIAVLASSSAIDITLAACSKGTAARALADRLALPRGRLAAIGDSANDIPMLREAGLALCPANATPEVRRLAAHVAPRPFAAGTLDCLAVAGARLAGRPPDEGKPRDGTVGRRSGT